MVELNTQAEENLTESTAEEPAAVSADATPAEEKLIDVGAKVDAGELVIPPTPPTVTKEGRLKISLTPVIATPRPEADIEKGGSLDVVSEPPFVRKTDASEKIVETAASKAPITEESVMADLKAGKEVVIGDRTIPAKNAARAAAIIESNPAEMLKFQRDVVKSQKEVATGEPRAAYTDFETGTVSIPEDMTDPAEVDSATKYAESRLAVNALIKPIIQTGDERLDVAARQIFVDHFTTDWTSQLTQRIADQGRGMVTLPNIAMFYAMDGAATLFSGPEGTTIGERWEANRADRERRYERMMGLIDEVLPGPTLAMHFNNEFRRIAGEYRDDGLMSEEDYQELVFEQVGEQKVERQFVDEDTAYQLMDMAFNQLSEVGQASLFVAENVLTAGAFVGSKSLQGKAYLENFTKMGQRLGAPADILDNPVALRSWIATNRMDIKVNDSLLQVGINLKNVSTNFDNLVASTRKLDDEVARLASEGKEKTTEYAMAVSNRDNAYRRISRAKIGLTTRPYLKEGTVDVAAMSLGQYAGVEYLTTVFGDQGLAEAAGMAASMFGGKYLAVGFLKGSFKLGMGVTGWAANQGMRSKNVYSMTRFLGDRISKNIPLKDSTIDDYERLVWQAQPGNSGKRMSMYERRMLRDAIEAANSLDENGRMLFGRDINNMNTMVDNIVSVFPEGEARQKAEQLFNGTVGDLLEISSLDAATGAINLRSFKPTKQSMEEIVFVMKTKKERMESLQLGLEAFEEHILQNPNASSSAPIRAMLSNMQSTVEKMEVKMVSDGNLLEQSMDTFIELTTSSMVSGEAEADFISSMVEVGVDLKTIMGEIVDEAQVIKGVNAAWVRGTNRRFDQMEAVRENAALHRTQLSRSLETLALDQLDLITAQGDAAYDSVRRYVQDTDRPRLDIAPAVGRMMKIIDPDETTSIEAVFGPDGLMFNSPVGRKSQKAFDMMAERGFARIGGEDAVRAIEEGILETVSEDARDGMAKYLAKLRRTREGRIEFALMAHQTGQINIFDGIRLDEVDVLRRAFRDYGYRVSKTNPSVGGKFAEFATFLDDVVREQDPQGLEVLQKARVKYQDAVGDATREGGTLAIINDSRTGGQRVSEQTAAPTRYFYSGKGPSRMFDSISEPMLGLIRKSGAIRAEVAQADLQEAVTDMAYSFGQKLPDGKKGFDLRTPEGREKFTLMNKAIRETVYEGWWRDFRGSASRRVGAKVKPEDTYDFTRSERVDNINNNMMVDVILEDGTPATIPVFDLGQLYRIEDMVVTNLEKGTELFDATQDYFRRVKARRAEVSGQAQVEKIKQKQLENTILSLAAINSPGDFFSKYIEGYGADISVLRRAYITGAVSLLPKGDAAAVKKAAEEAGEQFDSGIQSLTFQGILEKGGYGSSPDAKFDSILDGEKYAGKVLNDTSSLMTALRDENVQERLLQVMDPDAIEYMFNIVSYVHMKTVAGARLIHGRPMSSNEVISRAYNIAREMVSPLYVGTEIGIRLAQEANANILIMAMQNKEAGRIMDMILNNPKALTVEDLNNFDSMVLTFLSTQTNEQFMTKLIDTEESMNEQE